MKNILFHYEAGPALKRILENYREQGLEILCVDQEDDTGFEAALRESDIIWHVLKPITGVHIHSAPRLKLIQKIGVGTNTIDLEAAKQAGVSICNMPGTNTQAVAEMTLLLMLSAVRLQPRMDALCRSAQWSPDPLTREQLSEISGKTIGLIGFGNVPQRLAPILSAMGADVIYWSRNPKPGPYRSCTFQTVLREADIVSLHLPLTGETHHLIGPSELALMKRGSVIINTARGSLIDEASLSEALKSGHIRAAGLDVFETEPVTHDNALLALDQVALSPHTAWLTQETLERSLEIAVYNSLAITSGTPLRHQVI